MFRVESSKDFTPRSHRITCELPALNTYSADISNSRTVALMPRLSSTGFVA